MTPPPPPGKRPALRRDAERNRERILEAARRLLAERGLNVAYDEIAREAETGVGTVYRRFPTRTALFEELFHDRVDAVVAIAERGLRVEDPWEGLCQFLREDFELQADDRGLREFMLGRATGSALHQAARARIGPLVDELVQRAQASGDLHPDIGPGDLEIVLSMLGGLMDASATVAPELWRRYLDIILGGMRSSDSPEPLMGKTPARGRLDQISANWQLPRRT